jgi:Pvc16 N-terminal domain
VLSTVSNSFNAVFLNAVLQSNLSMKECPMLQDLDKTLEKLLSSELPSDIVQQVSFSFDTPDKDSIKTKPAINLFLYDVRENLELRNGVATYERQGDGAALKHRPPARVDCSYLITVWPTQPSNPEQEHQLLGEVMKVLLRYPKLPAQVLQGSLNGQEPPLRSLTLRPSQLQSLGEFWQAMGGKPKAALNYIVTISVLISTAAERVPLVTESRI